MNISMYQASLPGLIRSLKNLSAILKKGSAYAKAKKIDPAVLATSRLFPDMLPLIQQVQIATDTAKGAAGRLAGLEPPKYEDNETTLPELIARVDKTVAYLKTFKPAQIDGSETRDITLRFPNLTLNFKGLGYLFGFVIPNFYFHFTTAYDILRHNGVELGKADYLGKPPAPARTRAPKKTRSKKT